MHAAVLRYFDHVARHGSIRKAADALACPRQVIRDVGSEQEMACRERGRSGVRRRR